MSVIETTPFLLKASEIAEKLPLSRQGEILSPKDSGYSVLNEFSILLGVFSAYNTFWCN